MHVHVQYFYVDILTVYGKEPVYGASLLKPCPYVHDHMRSTVIMTSLVTKLTLLKLRNPAHTSLLP